MVEVIGVFSYHSDTGLYGVEFEPPSWICVNPMFGPLLLMLFADKLLGKKVELIYPDSESDDLSESGLVIRLREVSADTPSGYQSDYCE